MYKDRLREQKGETCAKPAKLALVMKHVFNWKSQNSSQKESKMGPRGLLWFTALRADGGESQGPRSTRGGRAATVKLIMPGNVAWYLHA